jgi:hypothetical protein
MSDSDVPACFRAASSNEALAQQLESIAKEYTRTVTLKLSMLWSLALSSCSP